MDTTNSLSRRITQSANKPQSPPANNNMPPITSESSNNSYLTAGSLEQLPNRTSPSLVVKLPYKFHKNSRVEKSKIIMQHSKFGMMTASSPLTELAQLKDRQEDHQAQDHTTTAQRLTPAYYQHQQSGKVVQIPQFMGMNNTHVFNPQIAGYSPITQLFGMGYGYGMNNVASFHPPGLGHNQVDYTSMHPEFYAGMPLAPMDKDYTGMNTQGPATMRNPRDLVAHRTASAMQKDFGITNSGATMSMEFQSMNDLAPANQAFNNATPVTTTSPKPLENFTMSSTFLQDMAPISTTQSKKTVSVTNITRVEADQRSLPPAGDQLARLVEDAKRRKEIPMCHRTADIRLIGGHWMAPAACKNCQNTKKTSLCDRNTPCKACRKKGISCATDGLMMVLRPSKKQSIVIAMSEETTDPQIAHPLSEPKKRKRTSPQNTINYNDGIIETDDQDHPHSDIEEVHRQVKVPKMSKADDGDDDFSLGGKQPSFTSSDKHVHSGERRGKENACDTGHVKKSKVRGRSINQSTKEAYHLNVQAGKPEPFGQPEVWAAKRQQLCETLPYYRAYESAAYTKDGTLYAFMIDREVGVRDKFTDQIIISKCGGGKTQDAKGKMVQSKDQEETSATGAAFLRAKKDKIPVAVIAGQGNSASPSKLPHYYNVLDWFQVTDIWCEKVDSGISLIARLEKINLGEMSWWAPKGTILAPPIFPSQKPHVQVCSRCKKSSKIIFNQGFTCLQRQCKKFFEFDAKYEDLDYNQEFLTERTQYLGEIPNPISPPLITLDEGDFGYEEKYRNGIVCPECRCCTRRIHWHSWVCENEGCSFTYRIPQQAVSVSDAIQQGRNSSNSHRLPKPICHPDIRWLVMSVGLYDVYEYIIPGEGDEICGFIRLFKSRDIINKQPDGPNDLFQQMQTEDFDLKRNAARLAGNVKEVSTSHFGTNWGAPYKYGVAQDSKGFNEAPEVIIKAVKRLTWAGHQTLTDNNEPFHPFNEMLTLGYFEQSHIGFHDDGEKELGPTVATLSLGADATMEFRPKLKSRIGAFRGADQSSGKGGRKKSVMLSLTLSHGDIIIMHGRAIQKHYEHAVKPHGKLRFALTSRYIDPLCMASDADREYSANAGELPLGSERFNYDGDINAKPVEQKRTLDHAAMVDNHIDALRLAGDMSIEDEKKLLLRRLEALH